MLFWIGSFCLGAVAVLQGGLNRQISREWGLTGAIFLNSLILFGLALSLVLVCSVASQGVPESFVPKWNFSAWRWWFVIPAMCGLTLVMGVPFLIPKVGASAVFLGIVVGQMVFSILWDLKVEQIPLDSKRFLGVGLALAGLFISYWKNPFSQT